MRHVEQSRISDDDPEKQSIKAAYDLVEVDDE